MTQALFDVVEPSSVTSEPTRAWARTRLLVYRDVNPLLADNNRHELNDGTQSGQDLDRSKFIGLLELQSVMGGRSYRSIRRDVLADRLPRALPWSKRLIWDRKLVFEYLGR